MRWESSLRAALRAPSRVSGGAAAASTGSPFSGNPRGRSRAVPRLVRLLPGGLREREVQALASHPLVDVEECGDAGADRDGQGAAADAADRQEDQRSGAEIAARGVPGEDALVGAGGGGEG